LLSGAILFIVVYLILAFLRMGYPFELEWIEGGSVDHVIRILSGQKLYVPPSLEFVPFIYTPLYFYLSAVLSKIVGIGFLPLRLLSFISSLGCFFIIFLMVKKETGSNFSGILASSLFAATFRISGAWFDIARADSLFLFFLLAGLYLIKFSDSAKSYIFAGVLVSLSFLTKQIALMISLPIMVFCVLSNIRRSVYFIGTTLAMVVLSTYIFNWLHDGWYSYYVFQVPKQHSGILESMFVKFWTKDIILPLSIASTMSIFYIFTQFWSSNKKNCLFYTLMPLAMIGGAWLSRLHLGGYNNVLFPAYAALSILFGLGIHAAFQFIQSASENKRIFMEIFIYLVCILQFLGLTYDPRAQVPTQRDLEAGRSFINTMAQMPGDILVPYHGYLPTLAGKRSYAHDAAITDIIRAGDCPAKTKLIDQINQAITERRFNAIILDTHWFQDLTDKHYTQERAVFTSPDVFWPVTGLRTRPQLVYVPKKE
jgi:4-amino-4-deoxy-L-arabinose transferase-like glycosyltransferase